MTDDAPRTKDDQTDTGDERALHRRWAVALFNRSWELMDRTERDADADAELVHTAHASLYHWLQIGAPENAARGEWQCARVYSVLGRPEPAIYHAQRVLAICRRHGIGDWDLGYAYEALARAHAVAGDRDAARHWLEEARRASEQVAEDDDRVQLLADLDTVPVGETAPDASDER
jgi:tetratricopeptide (TPR) repeat protein